MRRVRAGALTGRVIAAVIDGLLYFGLSVAAVRSNSRPALIAFFVFFVLYAPLMYALADGRTLGKMFGGVRVVRKDGRSIGFLQAFLRERIWKWVLGPVSVLIAVAREDRRALHDLLAGTRVIETAPEPAYLREPAPVHPEDSEPWPDQDESELDRISRKASQKARRR